jgi:hypothetical protein
LYQFLIHFFFWVIFVVKLFLQKIFIQLIFSIYFCFVCFKKSFIDV